MAANNVAESIWYDAPSIIAESLILPKDINKFDELEMFEIQHELEEESDSGVDLLKGFMERILNSIIITLTNASAVIKMPEDISIKLKIENIKVVTEEKKAIFTNVYSDIKGINENYKRLAFVDELLWRKALSHAVFAAKQAQLYISSKSLEYIQVFFNSPGQPISSSPLNTRFQLDSLSISYEDYIFYLNHIHFENGLLTIESWLLSKSAHTLLSSNISPVISYCASSRNAILTECNVYLDHMTIPPFPVKSLRENTQSKPLQISAPKMTIYWMEQTILLENIQIHLSGSYKIYIEHVLGSREESAFEFQDLDLSLKTNCVADSSVDPWPFSVTSKVFEDIPFVGIADQENLSSLKDLLENCAEWNLEGSVRSMKIRKASYSDSNVSKGQSKNFCIRISCQHLKFLCEDIYFEIDSADLFLWTKEKQLILDLSSNLTNIRIKDHQVLHQTVTPNLDGSSKSFNLTLLKSQRQIISMELIGFEFLLNSDILKRIVSQNGSAGRLSEKNGSYDLNISLKRCCLIPGFPLQCPIPHALYIESLTVVSSMELKDQVKVVFQSGAAYICNAPENILETSGLYTDGHGLWTDKGFARVIILDFVILQLDNQRKILTIENNQLDLHICRDSWTSIETLLNFYSELIRSKDDSRIEKTNNRPLSPDLIKDDPLSFPIEEEAQLMWKFSSSLDLDEKFFNTAIPLGKDTDWQSINAQKTSQASSFKESILKRGGRQDGVVFSGDEHAEDCIYVPEDATESIEIDPDYFTQPSKDTFPFSSEEFKGVYRICLKDFNASIKLAEGNHFKPNPKTMPCADHPSTRLPMVAEYEVDSFAFDPKSSSPTNPKTGSSISSGSSRWTAIARTKPEVPGNDSVEILLENVNAELDWNMIENITVLSNVRFAAKKFTIFDHVHSSRWKLLLGRKIDDKLMVGLDMIRIEFDAVKVGHNEALRAEDEYEYRLRIKLAPLRAHVDQDTLQFLLEFFRGGNSKDADRRDELFFQRCDLSPITVRFDYKPKRVDIKKIRVGKFVELMNLFQLEGTELVLPQVKLTGVQGMSHFGAELIRAWLPALKETQLSQVLAGISPIRTVVNMGKGLADLVLLPMQQYSRDGRILRGMRYGTRSFFNSTLNESIRIGSSLARHTQIMLEHVDDLFETGSEVSSESQVPEDVREGLGMGYRSLRRNIKRARDLVVAVPIQVYQQEGGGEAIKAVIRAVPIAVLRPMIGASDAVAKTFQGVQSSIDPTRAIEIKRKYK